MGPRVVWVLNLDADIELGAPGRYAPTARTMDAMRPHVATLSAGLLQSGEALLEQATRDELGGEVVGREQIGDCDPGAARRQKSHGPESAAETSQAHDGNFATGKIDGRQQIHGSTLAALRLSPI